MFRSLVAMVTVAVVLGSSPALYAQPATAPQSTSAGVVTEPAPVFLLPDATRTPLRTLPAGAVVSVREVREDWVQITFNDGILGSRTGWIQRRFLVIRERSEQPETDVAMPPRAPSSPATRPVRTTRAGVSPSLRGLVGVMYDKLTASESFAAVTGDDAAVSYGAGLQAVNLWRGLFAEAFVERTSLDGERVFVAGRDVFGLGIPIEITMTPIDIVGGWRVTAGDRFSTYGAAGVSLLTYEETSEFADADENVDERYTGWVVLGGVEVGLARWVHVRGEVRYRRFEDALGAGGASAAFGETQLGGLGAALKIVIGR
jgi:opacity protein-like surface antigen